MFVEAFGERPRRPDMAIDGRVLQRVIWGRSMETRPLYWKEKTPAIGMTGVVTDVGGPMRIPAGKAASFETYFNAFFEQNWRCYADLGPLALRVDLRGDCLLRIVRRNHEGEALVAEQRSTTGPCEIRLADPQSGVSFRQYGMLSLEIHAYENTELLDAAWVTLRADPPRHVGLSVIFCTFDREVDLAATLGAIVADAGLLARLGRIHIVNQGRCGLSTRLPLAPLLERAGSKINVIEQENFGGAGGFARGLLASLDDSSITHVAFLDDDIVLEPESLRRMAAFFSVANSNRPLGGHMLNRMRPRRVYEAGANIDLHNWSFHPQLHEVSLDDPHALVGMLAPKTVHYNGWWCFACSVDLVRQYGMPLPCFIRGDDLEFGLRLYHKGVPTIPMPGIAVWHEPFYLRTGGWQLYYETRNMLVTASLHLGTSPAGAVTRIARLFFVHLLSYRYYSAALILRGVSDFLQGPQAWRLKPASVHTNLAHLAKRYPRRTIVRETVLPQASLGRSPKTRLGCAAVLLRALVRNTLHATPPNLTPQRVEASHFIWSALLRCDCVALDNWWEPELPVYRRDRVSFVALGLQAVVVLARLSRRFASVAEKWREKAPQLTSPEGWRRYLGLPPKMSGPGRQDPKHEVIVSSAASFPAQASREPVMSSNS